MKRRSISSVALILVAVLSVADARRKLETTPNTF